MSRETSVRVMKLPLMIYTFLQNAMKKHGRPVTTAEIEAYAHATLPMCADHVVHHIVELERKGIVTKRFDKERKGYAWQPTKDYTIQEIIDKFPELYKHSLYYHTVAEALGERISMEEAMQILYEISGGTENKPTINEIKKRLKMRKSGRE